MLSQVETYSTDQRKGKQLPRAIRGLDAINLQAEVNVTAGDSNMSAKFL